MFIPIHDANPLRAIHFQFVTVTLILANVAVHLWQIATQMPADPTLSPDLAFALVPTELLGEFAYGGRSTDLFDALPVPETGTLISYQFLHGNWLHLFGNMLFLWVFGDNVEDAMGHLSFLLFYILCGIAAAMAHVVMEPSSGIPLVGASGSVAGVVAAYVMLHPRVQLWVLVLRVLPLQIMAFWALGAWIGFQLLMAVAPSILGGGDPSVAQVAWWAHVGGILAGMVLILIMRRPGVPLFDRGAT